MENNKSKTTEKSNEEIEAGLNKRKAYTVFFTFSPKHELADFSGSDEDITRAVSEAAFIASVLRHELVTDELAETIRGFVFSSCLFLAQSLERHKADEQMIIDIYPYARIAESEMFARLFNNFFLEVQQTAPELFQSLAEVKSDAKN